MTFSIMTFSITTFSIMTLSITTLSTMGSFTTLSMTLSITTLNDIDYWAPLCWVLLCCYAEGRVFIVMLSFIMLSVIMLSVIMLSVASPFDIFGYFWSSSLFVFAFQSWMKSLLNKPKKKFKLKKDTKFNEIQLSFQPVLFNSLKFTYYWSILIIF